MERHPDNPIIGRSDIPSIPPHLKDVTSVFNPGAVRFGDKFLLMLRVQNRGRHTFFLMAESIDGIDFTVREETVQFKGIERVPEKVFHCYDARITPLDGQFFIMFAMDTESGCRLGLARTEDFREFEFMGVTSEEDNRNGVLFPDKIDGKYLRLDRPNKMESGTGPLTGDAINFSESKDLLNWRPRGVVMTGRPHYWDEMIGAGPPPVKTRKGWLQVYHGVTLHLSSAWIYQAGVALLDLNDPLTIVGRSPYNILEPRMLYELVGQVPNVIFPSGLIVEDCDTEGFARDESRIFLYYGAADTSVCLALTTVRELVEAALFGNEEG